MADIGLVPGDKKLRKGCVGEYNGIAYWVLGFLPRFSRMVMQVDQPLAKEATT